MKKIFFIIYMLLLLVFIRLNGAERVVKLETEVDNILNKITPSVVKVVSENHRKYIATGVVLESDLVISNVKVIGHPFDRIYIETVKGDKFDVKIVGKDISSSLILLKTERKTLKPAKRGKTPKTGKWIGLVGVFYKQFPFLNQGIVSSQSKSDLILNATVAPGSTGGAVINRKGEFIGIIRGVFGYKFFPQYTFKDNQSELKIASSIRGGNDLCYALPAEKVFRIAEDLKKFGRVKRGWLGVSVSVGENGFVRVENVVKKSPAQMSGILKGDLIKKVSGAEIKTPLHLSENIRMMRPGDKIPILINRGGKELKLKVKLAEMKTGKTGSGPIGRMEFGKGFIGVPEAINSLPKIPNYTFDLSGAINLGAEMIALTPELAKEYGIKSGGGLLVSRIKDIPDSKKTGLKVGDILVKADGRKLKRLSNLKRVLEKLKPKEKLTVELMRKGKYKKIKILPVVTGNRIQLLDEFFKKLSGAKFWMEKEMQLKMKKELERVRELKLRELKENKSYRNNSLKLKKELERIKRERLEKYKMEIEKLMKEKRAIEEELKKLKKKD